MQKKKPNCEDVQRLIADEQEASEEYASYGEDELSADEARHKIHWLEKEPEVCSDEKIAYRHLTESREALNKRITAMMEPMHEFYDK